MASNSNELIKFKNGYFKFTGNVSIYLQKHFFWEFRDLIKRQAEPSGRTQVMREYLKIKYIFGDLLGGSAVYGAQS